MELLVLVHQLLMILTNFAKEHKVKILSYQVVRYEQLNLDRTYILAEVIK